MTMEIDMFKKADFDINFSFASKNMNLENNNNNDQNNNYLLIHQNMRDIDAGRTLSNSPKKIIINNCEKENKIIKEQVEQTLSLLNIINSYQTEYNKHMKQKNLYSMTCKKSDDLKRFINIIIMIVILILIITMLYIHKHRIIS
jgi:hypothetical protein